MTALLTVKKLRLIKQSEAGEYRNLLANLFASGDEIGVINVLETGVVYLSDTETHATFNC